MAQLSLAGNVGTEDVAGSDMQHTELPGDDLRLGSFARPRRADEKQPH